MKRNTSPRTKRSNKTKQKKRKLLNWVNGRLTSYTTAAGLGAFGLAQNVEGGIVFTDVPDTTITQGDSPLYIDLNNDVDGGGQQEFAIAAVLNSIRINPYNLGPQASATLTSGSYYVFSFASGDAIGPGAASSGGANFAGRVSGPYFYNFVETDKFVGLKWDAGGGDIHYGWARIDVTSANNGTATLFSYAYEDTPNTAILAGAGIPEPTSLALLAAGGGALALTRRRRRGE